MNSVIPIIIALVVCFAVVSDAQTTPSPVSSSPSHRHRQHKQPKCLGAEVKVSEEQEATMKACWNKTMGSTGADKKKESMMCSMVCKSQAFGLMDAAGKLIEAKVSPFVKGIFPEAAADKITQAITTCSQQKGGSVVIVKDDCSSFKDLFDCIKDETKKICMPEKAA